jgi:hypothetical protein
MYVIGFLCVSLGSSAVQLHDSLGSRRACACSETGFSSKNGDRVWRVFYRRAVFCCALSVQTDSMKRIFTKKCFLFTLGSVCRVKRSTAGSRNSLKEVRKSQMMKRRCGSGWDNGQKLLCCGFRRTAKAMGQAYQCWWRICREINVFSTFEYHMCCVLFAFVTYLLTLPRTFSDATTCSFKVEE